MSAPVQSATLYPGHILAYPSNVTAGNLLIAAASWAGSATPTISDTQGNTWKLIANSASDLPYDYNTQLALWYAWNCKGGATTVTFNNTADAGVSVYEYSAADIDMTSDPLLTVSIMGGLGNGSGGATTTPATAAMGIGDTAMIFAAWANEVGGGPVSSAGTGFTLRQHNDGHYDAQEDQFGALPGSYAPSFHVASAEAHWAMAAAAFRQTGNTQSALSARLVMPWGQRKPPPGALLNPAHPLARGLVAAYVANEGGGLSAFDSSGNNNTGTLNGMATWGPGSYGAALKFLGVGSAGDTAGGVALPNLFQNSDFTLAAFIKLSAVPSSLGLACGLSNGNVQIRINSTPVLGYSVDGANVDTGATVLSPGTPYCIALVYSAGTVTLYLNGQKEIQSARTLNYLNSNNALGAFNAGGTFGLPGVIDQFLYYNRALSVAEVQRLCVEPFCFMRPIQRRILVPVIAAASATFGFAGAGGIQGTGQMGIAG